MGTAPSPQTWSNGVLVDDTALNAQVRDPLKFLLDPPRVKLRQIAAQSIPNASYTALTFTAEDYDNELPTGMHDLVTNNTRITCRTAGTYLCTGQVGWAGNATGRRGMRWDLNGSPVQGAQNIVAAGVASGIAIQAPTIYVAMSVGDYLELMAFQESGGALNTVVVTESQPTATARWVGP